LKKLFLSIALALTLLGFVIGAFFTWQLGTSFVAPANHPIGVPPTDLQATTISITTPENETVSGWFANGNAGGGAVLLLHGVRSDRTQMLARARLLRNAGYAVLLIDLHAHGESSGAAITFGAREAQGVSAAINYLQQQLPREKIGIIGVSLGAASAVLAKPEGRVQAMVLESMFPTIEDAIANRVAMPFGKIGYAAAPLLLAQLPLRLGVWPSELRPIKALPALTMPMLIASGAQDAHTTWAETQRIFDAVNQPKLLWKVEGAGHVDLQHYDPTAYENIVRPFLRQYLQAK
jgi:uncharacterized protein